MSQPLVLARSNYNLLSKQQKQLADYIMANPDEAAEMGIEELSQQCGVSKTTVLRLLRKLGYQSYRVFHTDLIKEITSNSAVRDSVLPTGDYLDVGDDDNYQIAQKVTGQLSTLITDLPSLLDYEMLEKASDALCKADRVLFFAIGGTSSLVLDAYHKFLRLGMNAFYETNNHLALIRSSHFGKKDVLFLISRTGESREVLECAMVAKKNGCTILSMTSFFDSSLAEISDIVLLCSFADSKWDTDYMVTRAMLLTMIDILYLCVRRDLNPAATEALRISTNALMCTKVRPNRSKAVKK